MRQHSVSQYSEDTIGISVFEQGALADADNDPLVTITRLSDNTVIVNQDLATRDDTGLYSYQVGTFVTSQKDKYTERWDYTVGGIPRVFEDEFEVGNPQPYWDSLNPDQKNMVDNVYFKISDLFDSTEGGPYLWELPQTTFGFETIARLMVTDAVNYINFSRPPAFLPPFQVGATVQKAFPTGWYGLLEKSTYIEVLKHLQRSYIEQPVAENISTARLDRTEYWQKWGVILAQEKQELDHYVAMMKRQYRFGLMSRGLLLAGGYWPISYYSPLRPRWPYSPSMRLT